MQQRVWRCASIILGVVTTLLGMYGAYTFGLKLEGGVSYITIAAPVIAGAAALIPPLAEQAWRERQYAKSLLWWAVLVPAAATVFFGAAERVHVAKAGAEAERSALRQEASRASRDLAEVKDEALKAEARFVTRGLDPAFDFISRLGERLVGLRNRLQAATESIQTSALVAQASATRQNTMELKIIARAATKVTLMGIIGTTALTLFYVVRTLKEVVEPEHLGTARPAAAFLIIAIGVLIFIRQYNSER